MKRTIRYIGNCGSYGGAMVLVTTEYSIFDIMHLFSSAPMKDSRVYRYDGVEFTDFNGLPPTKDVLDAIMDKKDQLGFELQQK